MTTSTTAIITYCTGAGWGRTSPGSRPGAGCTTRAGSCSPTRATAVSDCSSCVTAPSSSLTSPPSGCDPPGGLLLREQVDDGEDHDPHHVDEMPVETGDLDAFGISLCQPALDGEAPQRHEPHDARGHVGTVQTREHVEARPEEVGVDVQALAGELGELEHLAADERR